MEKEEKLKIGLVEFSIIEKEDYIWFTRIYIPPEHREKHLAVPALKELINKLSNRKKEIFGSVLPDLKKSTVTEEILAKEYEKLRHILRKAGFTPNPEYRNDLTYYYG